MNDPLFPTPDGPLDKLVRRRLDADADGAAAEEAWRKAKARRPGGAWGAWLARGVMAAAAAVLVAAFLFWPGGKAQASPAEMVARARDAHQDERSREYSLTADPPAALVRRFPRVDFGREISLWTRGDRFRVEPAPGGGVWGQDEQGNVWFAPTRKFGVWFGKDEIPPAYKEALAVRSVQLPTLLDEVLKDCDVERVPGGDPVETTLEAFGNGSLRRAEIVIGPADVVRRLTLVRRLPGGEDFTLKLMLRAQGEKPADFYRLAGALDAGGERIGPPTPRGARIARLLLTK